MRKQYISELIDESTYSDWLYGKKVMLNAPTGAGKTTFILSVFLKYCKRCGKKMLILVNRRLLREQYDYDLADIYLCYREMCNDIKLLTYQELSEKIKLGKDLSTELSEYDVIVCDEVHYFYNDSEFNALGTYVLLQAMIKAAFFKTIIFITATLDEVRPLLERTILKCADKIREESGEIKKCEFQITTLDFGFLADYERFRCCFIPDVQSLAETIANSDKKALIFIDDKAKAEAFKKLLIQTDKVKESDVTMLNAQSLEENLERGMVRMLSIGNKLLKKILITTSVLDNGVSIHDPEVGSVVIATESKVSFLQMLGRIRSESIDSCTLYIYPREIEYYSKRIRQYSARMEFFEQYTEEILRKNFWEILYQGWFDNDEKANILRNMIILTNSEVEFYDEEFTPVRFVKEGYILAVNHFAKEKIGNMLQAEKRFLKLALEDFRKVVCEQIQWIGKSEEELEIMCSTFNEEREKLLVAELLKIQNYSNEEYIKAKEYIAKEFHRELCDKIILKNTSISKEKFSNICDIYGLLFNAFIGKDKKMYYSVIRKNEMKENDF